MKSAYVITLLHELADILEEIARVVKSSAVPEIKKSKKRKKKK